VSIRKIQLCATTAFLIATSLVRAQDSNFQEVPTNWRLQNYLGNGVTVWYTSSTCRSGQLVFPAGTSSDDENRFWALVLAAKIASQPVGIYYNSASGYCEITSYYLTP
jgi:hypothetical protein